MQTSLFIARLIGPVMVVTGLISLFDLDGLKQMAREFLASRGLIFLAGFLTLLGGLVIVNTHNLWVADWPVIITVFGWIMIAAGIMRMGLPGLVKSIGETMLAKEAVLRVSGVVQLALGAFLMFKGYL